MRIRFAYFALLLIAASAGYWVAVRSGAGPASSPAQGDATFSPDPSALTNAVAEPAVTLPEGIKSDISPVAMDSDESNNVAVYRAASPAVVNITTQTVELDFFFRPVPRGGSGSGFIVDEEGHIVTNHHVIDGAEDIQVTLADRRTYKAEIVGSDLLTDLAVLKISGAGRLRSLTLGDSTRLQVGQKVLAIGNPFGLTGTLTTGVISALERSLDTGQGSLLDEAIQTDAAINPGNSGGPLLDSQGRVIGVNTLIQTPSGGSVGLGFAIPVNTLKWVLSDLMEFGRVRRGSLGVQGAPLEMLPRLVEHLDLPVSRGILLGVITPDSGAERAGLRGGTRSIVVGRYRIRIGGDIITALDGEKVSTAVDVNRALYKRRPGDPVEVEYYRDGKRRTVKVTLSERPEERRSRRRRQ